jgi:DsbE subfamily thiol:disulfide oxidoreductase
MKQVGINRLRLWSVATAIGFVASTWQAGASAQLPAPNVALRTADGDTLQLSAYKGKVVLVDFWASWCVPCKTSFPALDAIYREYEARGLEVFAVNLDDDRRSADAFLAAHPHQMTVTFDPNGDAPVAFGVKGMPTSFLIDKAGKIRFTHQGYTASVAASYRQEIDELLAEK